MKPKCTCAYFKCVARGLKPANHAWSCHMFKQETNICKEEWINENDRIHYLKQHETKNKSK